MSKYITTREDIKRSHQAIINYLDRRNFSDYVRKNDKTLKIQGQTAEYLYCLFEIFCADSFGKSLPDICTQMEKKLKQLKLNNSFPASKENISRLMNKFIKVANHLCNTEPDIKVFYSSTIEFEEPIGFHLACSKSTQETGRKSSYDIVPFSQAIKLSDIERQEFLAKLKEEAEKGLAEKLYTDDTNKYQPLKLRIRRTVKNDSQVKDKKNKWVDFDTEILKKRKGVYLLNSDAGTGKTTFLRSLQKELINSVDCNFIPIFLDASEIEKIKFWDGNVFSFLKAVSQKYHGCFDWDIERFLKDNIDDIVFIIDGVDQIAKIDTYEMIKKITRMLNKNLIVSSRPFPSDNSVEEKDVELLSLKPFSDTDLAKYLGDDFETAKLLCKKCPNILRVPMLCCMVAHILENDGHSEIDNRTELYTEFVNSILGVGRHAKSYRHENLKMSREKKLHCKKALQKISFDAINNGKMFLQRVPFEFACKCLTGQYLNIEVDDLPKLGLASIIDPLGDHDEFVCFAHLSFQEYLAAVHISETDGLVELVLKQKWDPKWKDVIKFTVGIMGDRIVSEILAEQDNPINSKLFLCTELISETNISKKTKETINSRLEPLIRNPLFSDEAKKRWRLANKDVAIQVFTDALYNGDVDETRSQLNTLGDLQIEPSEQIIDKLFEMLDSEKSKYVDLALDIIESFKYQLNNNMIKKIVSRLKNAGEYDVYITIDIFSRIGDMLDLKATREFLSFLNNDDIEIVRDAVDALFGFRGNPIAKEISDALVEKVFNNDKKVAFNALENLPEFIDFINQTTFYRVFEMADADDPDIASNVISAISSYKGIVSDDRVFWSIISKLKSNNRSIAISAYNALGKINWDLSNGTVDQIIQDLKSCSKYTYTSLIVSKKCGCFLCPEIINTVANLLDSDDEYILKAAIEFFGQNQYKIDCDILDKLLMKLDSKSDSVVITTLDTLKVLGETLPMKVSRIIVDKVIDAKPNCRQAALFALRDIKKDDYVINKIISMFDSNCKFIIRAAICSLKQTGGEEDRIIANKIAEKFLLPNNPYASTAALILSRYGDAIDETVIRKMVNTENSSVYQQLKYLYPKGLLEFQL